MVKWVGGGVFDICSMGCEFIMAVTGGIPPIWLFIAGLPMGFMPGLAIMWVIGGAVDVSGIIPSENEEKLGELALWVKGPFRGINSFAIGFGPCR